MLTRTLRRFLVFGLALVLVGCLALPSDQQVAQKFKREHPGYTVQSVSHRLAAFPGSSMPVEAVFRVIYTEPGAPRPRIFERRFGRVAEGWLERPVNAGPLIPPNASNQTLQPTPLPVALLFSMSYPRVLKPRPQRHG
jgi:hypothetical protein